MSGAVEVQSLRRALDLLRIIAWTAPGSAHLKMLVERSQLAKPTVHRLLKQLLASGILSRGPNRTYQLGPVAYEFGMAAARVFPIRELARPVLERLARETGETAYLVIRSGSDSLCIDRNRGPSLVKVPLLNIGHRQPMGVGAAGLAMLSFMDTAERAEVLAQLDRRLARRSYNRLTGGKLRTLVADTRERGWATVSGYAVPNVTGVALPLFNGQHRPFAAITVAGVSAHMTRAKVARIAAILRSSVDLLEGALPPVQGLPWPHSPSDL